MAAAKVVIERVGPRVDADQQPDRQRDSEPEREERDLAGAGQREARERLAALQPRPAGHDHEDQDDRERHGLREAGQRCCAHAEHLRDVGTEERQQALGNADPECGEDGDTERRKAPDQRGRECGKDRQ